MATVPELAFIVVLPPDSFRPPSDGCVGARPTARTETTRGKTSPGPGKVTWPVLRLGSDVVDDRCLVVEVRSGPRPPSPMCSLF